jgi:hypothetical protein
MNTYCTGCHGSMGSKSGVANDASKIERDINNGNMPIAPPYPSQTEITEIDNWFSSQCNMP